MVLCARFHSISIYTKKKTVTQHPMYNTLYKVKRHRCLVDLTELVSDAQYWQYLDNILICLGDGVWCGIYVYIDGCFAFQFKLQLKPDPRDYNKPIIVVSEFTAFAKPSAGIRIGLFNRDRAERHLYNGLARAHPNLGWVICYSIDDGNFE